MKLSMGVLFLISALLAKSHVSGLKCYICQDCEQVKEEDLKYCGPETQGGSRAYVPKASILFSRVRRAKNLPPNFRLDDDSSTTTTTESTTTPTTVESTTQTTTESTTITTTTESTTGESSTTTESTTPTTTESTTTESTTPTTTESTTTESTTPTTESTTTESTTPTTTTSTTIPADTYYACYKSTKDGKKSRGCAAIPKGQAACKYIHETVDVKIENCEACENDRCNSSAIANLSIVALLTMILITFVV